MQQIARSTIGTRRWILVCGALIAALTGLPAQAAAITFLLDQSNADAAFPDGTPYLEVTVSDGHVGAIDFTVRMLPATLTAAGPNFGLQSFGFNLGSGAAPLSAANILGLPAGWGASTEKRQDGFGRFAVVVGDAPGGGNVRVTPELRFSIIGLNGDSIHDYVALSGGGVTQGRVYYAAHVAGFIGLDTLLPPSAYFGGSRATSAAAVPVPAPAWLLGSALGLLGGVRWRTGRQSAT